MADSTESTQTSMRRDSGIGVGGIRVYGIFGISRTEIRELLTVLVCS